MDYLEHTAMRHAMSDELYHHGILGMKWGVRRYQNPDGTLTSAGKKRYSSLRSSNEKLEGKIAKENANIEKRYKRMPERYFTDIGKYRQEKAIRKIEVSNKKIREYEEQKNKNNAEMDELKPKPKPKNIEERLSLAKEKDMFAIDFLEIVPGNLLESGGEPLIKEYKKYLEDPEKYATGE